MGVDRGVGWEGQAGRGVKIAAVEMGRCFQEKWGEQTEDGAGYRPRSKKERRERGGREEQHTVAGEKVTESEKTRARPHSQQGQRRRPSIARGGATACTELSHKVKKQFTDPPLQHTCRGA
eukprot:6188992-Pleurochrysis_carterae.AAC.4